MEIKRQLILVIDHGPEDDKLKGVDIDEGNYLAFFKSPEGGAWDDDEIKVYHDNFDIKPFSDLNKLRILRGTSFDYYLIVFCGHGSETPNHIIKFELKPGMLSTLNDIQSAVGASRCLFIADSCRYIERRGEGGQLVCFSAVTESANINIETYREQCRNLYNDLIMSMPEGTFVAGLAASSGEFANESSIKGGFYSHSLITAACDMRDEIQNLHKKNIGIKIPACPFSDVHQRAYNQVVAMNNRQHPELLSPRRVITFPFVVVPRKRITRILG